MSYFNPEIYNYDRLKPEDQKLIDAYDMADKDALNKDFILDDMMGLGMDRSGRGQHDRQDFYKGLKMEWNKTQQREK